MFTDKKITKEMLFRRNKKIITYLKEKRSEIYSKKKANRIVNPYKLKIMQN